MRVVVDVNHPHQVHLFKNFIWEMEKRGHEILVTASKKDISIDLLNIYCIDHIVLGSYGKSVTEKLYNLMKLDIKMYNAVKNFNPDIFLGMSSIRAAHISRLMNKVSITFQDTEPGMLQDRILFCPFTDAIITPNCFKMNYGKKHFRYNGYQELAYLHPNYFKPDPSVLDEIGLNQDDDFILMRFVGWTSPHEIGMKSLININEFISELEQYGKILITSEYKLDKDLEKYRIKLPINKIHDLLYFSRLFIGESQTMTTEAGILGTPAIRCNNWVGDNDMGNFSELELKYNLIYNFSDTKKALEKAIELLNQPELKNEWAIRRERLLRENIDLTSLMIWLVENYPESIQNMKKLAKPFNLSTFISH